MDDDTNDLVAGLKADVDQHLGAKSAPTQDSQAPGDDLVAGLKADVDRSLAPAPAVKAPVATSAKVPFAKRVMQIESHGDPTARAVGSSAAGSGQFIDSTWIPLVRRNRPDLADGKSDAEILAMRKDPNLSEQMIDAYGNDNAKALQSHGIPVSDATKYGAHWFGPANYQKIHTADPSAPIEGIIGANAAANNNLTGKTAGDIKALTESRMGTGTSASPEAPEQQRDWGDTIEQAGENLLPSGWNLAKSTAKSVAHAALHPVDTAGTLVQIGKGLKSKLAGFAGDDQDPEQKEKDEALVNAMGHQIGDKWTDIDKFKEALANDPASLLFDASTVLSAGGTGIAKVGSLIGDATRVGDALGTAGRAAGAVGKAVNPLNPMGVVSDTVKKLTAPAAAFDKAGNIAPKVDDLIKKTTNGTMSGADLVDPEVKAAFAATIAKKGLSEASVREGLLRSLDLKAPTQSVTGASVASAAKEATAAAIEHNNGKLDEHAAKLGGTASTSDLGSALDQAHTNSINQASAAYDKIGSTPGTFGKAMPELPQFGADIKKRFTASRIPNSDPAALAASHPQAAAAIKFMQSTWGKQKTLLTKDFNSGEVLAMRKELNNFRSKATGSDVKAVGDITDAFDNHIQDLANRGFFRDSSGNQITDLGAKIKAANAGYKAHFNTFDQSPNSAMRGAVAQLKDKQTFFNGQRMPSGDIDRYSTAQDALGRQLLHPTKGANTYNQLKSALGGNSAPIDDFVKSMVLNGNKPMKDVGKLLNNPNSVVSKAFSGSPGDLSQARHIQAAREITNTKPTAAKTSGLKDMLTGIATKGGASVLGYETMGLPGAIMGPLAEHGLERIKDARAAKAAVKGAPKTSGVTMRTIKNVARKLTSPVGIASAHYKDEAQKVNDAIPRASGGKVDSDALVTRLISRWKSAKKETDATTKPLLNVPDATIVKALDIAQEHI